NTNTMSGITSAKDGFPYLNLPVLEKARVSTAKAKEELNQLLQKNIPGYESEDTNLVVFGSLARGEWTSGSDLDWTYLIDGQANHEHANTAHRIGELLRQEEFTPPGPTGIFGNLAFSHNIIHQIGGQDDSNRNTTQRM